MRTSSDGGRTVDGRWLVRWKLVAYQVNGKPIVSWRQRAFVEEEAARNCFDQAFKYPHVRRVELHTLHMEEMKEIVD